MIIRKGGILPRNTVFHYNNSLIDIVSKFLYLGIVFTTSGSFTECQSKLAGQAQIAIFKLNKCLYKFVNIAPKHRLELFDKLITPILIYGSEVWRLCKGNQIERVHMKLCKHLLGVKSTTQNNFVYGELGRINYYMYTHRLYTIIKQWLKIINCNDNKYIKYVYKLLLNDIHKKPNIKNWANMVKIHSQI